MLGSSVNATENATEGCGAPPENWILFFNWVLFFNDTLLIHTHVHNMCMYVQHNVEFAKNDPTVQFS